MSVGGNAASMAAAAQKLAASMSGVTGAKAPEPTRAHYEAELEINDFPQHARWKVRGVGQCPSHCARWEVSAWAFGTLRPDATSACPCSRLPLPSMPLLASAFACRCLSSVTLCYCPAAPPWLAVRLTLLLLLHPPPLLRRSHTARLSRTSRTSPAPRSSPRVCSCRPASPCPRASARSSC